MEEGHLIDLDLARDATGCVTTDLNQFMDKVMVPIMAMFMVMMQASTAAMMATVRSRAAALEPRGQPVGARVSVRALPPRAPCWLLP